jgi:hypothetical protein
MSTYWSELEVGPVSDLEGASRHVRQSSISTASSPSPSSAESDQVRRSVGLGPLPGLEQVRRLRATPRAGHEP